MRRFVRPGKLFLKGLEVIIILVLSMAVLALLRFALLLLGLPAQKVLVVCALAVAVG